MLEERFVVTDRQWRLMEPHCLGKKSDPGRTGGDGRLFLEAVPWRARTGSPRRVPPLNMDRDIYEWRHSIENFFGKLKEIKSIAMRACKAGTSFEAMIYVGSAIINSR